MAGINGVNSERFSRKLLDGNVTLITGASRGIGRAIAHRLATLGASVAICGRDRATRSKCLTSSPKPNPRLARSTSW